MTKKMLVNFVQEINASKIRNETLDGADYLVMPSYTMPDDVVLNGILYPASEIDRTIKTIDGSPAPIDHPKINGKYVSAYDPRAALEFGAGVNKYIGKEDNIHHIEKWFNKEILNNTDRGRRLLQAVNEGSTIHSSTGVMLTAEEKEGKNSFGAYNSIATIDHFDHDAALPDSTGAGTPEATGTGIRVNSEGEEAEFDVFFVNLTSGDDFSGSANETRSKLKDAVTALVNPASNCDSWCYVEDFNQDTVIYEYNDELKAIKYLISDGEVVLVGEPKETTSKRVFEFNTEKEQLTVFKKLANKLGFNFKQQPQPEEVDKMKKKMITALNAAGIATEGLTDDQLFSEHSKLISTNAVKDVKQPEQLTAENVAKIVTDTLAANKADEAKVAKTGLVEQVIANSEAYTEEDKELLLNTDKRILRGMLPAKVAATLGLTAPLQTNEASDHEIDLNEMLKGGE
jgi:hypothetical protein